MPCFTTPRIIWTLIFKVHTIHHLHRPVKESTRIENKEVLWDWILQFLSVDQPNSTFTWKHKLFNPNCFPYNTTYVGRHVPCYTPVYHNKVEYPKESIFIPFFQWLFTVKDPPIFVMVNQIHLYHELIVCLKCLGVMWTRHFHSYTVIQLFHYPPMVKWIWMTPLCYPSIVCTIHCCFCHICR